MSPAPQSSWKLATAGAPVIVSIEYVYWHSSRPCQLHIDESLTGSDIKYLGALMKYWEIDTLGMNITYKYTISHANMMYHNLRQASLVMIFCFNWDLSISTVRFYFPLNYELGHKVPAAQYICFVLPGVIWTLYQAFQILHIFIYSSSSALTSMVHTSRVWAYLKFE